MKKEQAYFHTVDPQLYLIGCIKELFFYSESSETDNPIFNELNE